MKELAKNIIRHSVVKYESKLYMIENRAIPIQLIPPTGDAGIEVKRDALVEVVKYPAQLAMDFINAHNKS